MQTFKDQFFKVLDKLKQSRKRRLNKINLSLREHQLSHKQILDRKRRIKILLRDIEVLNKLMNVTTNFSKPKHKIKRLGVRIAATMDFYDYSESVANNNIPYLIDKNNIEGLKNSNDPRERKLYRIIKSKYEFI